MRILSLHGMGTTSEIFKIQTAGIRQELGGDKFHEFDFVEGNVDWAPAKGIQLLCPKATEFFSFFDPADAQSALDALDSLQDYVDAEGPFDGVMGFSQDATLAAMLLLRANNRPTRPAFSFAVFFCGGAPMCESSLRKGIIRYLDPSVDSVRVTVPTANIVGKHDENLAYSMRLVDMCSEKTRTLFDHGASHEIPFQPKTISGDMARCIEAVMAKAVFAQ